MLEGRNIHLQTVKEEDLSEVFSFFNSIRMKGEYLPGGLLSEQQFRMQYYETGFWSEDRGILLLWHQNRLIGAIWFDRQLFLDCLDLHFYIFRKEERNKGWMTEALCIFTQYLFATKKIERLQITIPDYSKAALRVAQKCAFHFEGIARSALFHRGKYLDLCIYSLLRSECKEIEKIYTER